jgi:hypothetical protein
MKDVLNYLFAVLIMGIITACFMTFPTSWEEFSFGLLFSSVFWLGMLAPMLTK